MLQLCKSRRDSILLVEVGLGLPIVAHLDVVHVGLVDLRGRGLLSWPGGIMDRVLDVSSQQNLN